MVGFLIRAGVLSVLWWLLAGGAVSSWIFGAPAILVAAALRSRPPEVALGRVRLGGLARFVPYFVRRSLVGGLDVAWRAMHPGLPISPDVQCYPYRLPAQGPARVFFANCVNLLPGTLVAEWEGEVLTIHLLTASPTAIAEMRQMEEQVARLFGVELAPPGGDR